MKRYVLLALLVLTLLLLGPQAAFSQAGATVDRGNAVPREALPEELQALEVKDFFIDSDTQHAGFIQTVIGHVIVLHEDSRQAFFAAAGDAVFKHDSIFTLADSRCRLKFTTEDVITIGDNTRLGLEEYIDNRPEKKKTSIFNLLRGKAMFYAVRLFKYRTAATSVKTPTAVVGVRGTKFGVEVRKAGENIAAGRPVYLAAASDAGLQHLLAQFSPGGWVTLALCFTGAIDVTALADNTTQTLYENESRAASSEGGENKQPTSPDAARQFESATEAPEPGAAAKEEGKKAEGTPAGGAAPVSAADTGAAGTTETELANKAEDVTSKQTDVKVATEGSTGLQVRKGYFAGMLTNHGSAWLENVYVSTSRQDFDSATTAVRAEGLHHKAGDDAFLEGMPGQAFNDPKLKQVKSYDYMDTIISDDNLNFPVTHQEIGHNTYQEWGWWFVAQDFPMGNGSTSTVHDLWQKGYYIFGDPTPDAAVAGISGTYSGNALGTYWSHSTVSSNGYRGVEMTGTFSCYVNGPASQIENFTMNVQSSTGDYKAKIEYGGVSGNFASSSFHLDDTKGTWELTAVPVTYTATEKSGHGTLNGPNGEKISGAWGMIYCSENGAAGIIQGSKQ